MSVFFERERRIHRVSAGVDVLMHREFLMKLQEVCGEWLLDLEHDLVVANSFFKKRDVHLITFQSGGHSTQIDYLLVRRSDLRACRDCRVFPGETCSSQHKLLALEARFASRQPKRAATGLPKILWKNLKGEAAELFRVKVAEGLANRPEDLSARDADQMWDTLAGIIKDAAKDSLGVTRGAARTQSTSRESWWYSEEVQSKVATKQSRFRELTLCRQGHQVELTAAKNQYFASSDSSCIGECRCFNASGIFNGTGILCWMNVVIRFVDLVLFGEFDRSFRKCVESGYCMWERERECGVNSGYSTHNSVYSQRKTGCTVAQAL
ncbi:hypothetical protein CTI12_AA217890 [Artemisia annua]|uniref:Uncharacterized protein n=1 Tax=Artemisia annua TaxID=35608 RepID=A0A2U1NW68_ARTAN|nr:hypothetical protein CTI12_AA217890 [Artemisia annua]